MIAPIIVRVGLGGGGGGVGVRLAGWHLLIKMFNMLAWVNTNMDVNRGG